MISLIIPNSEPKEISNEILKESQFIKDAFDPINNELHLDINLNTFNILYAYLNKLPIMFNEMSTDDLITSFKQIHYLGLTELYEHCCTYINNITKNCL